MRVPAAIVAVLLIAPVHAGARQEDAGQAVAVLFSMYDRGNYSELDRILLAGARTPLARAFPKAAAQWVGSGPSEERDRRRQVAAAVALEILGAGLTLEWGNLSSLVEAGCALVRQTPQGSASEESWHLMAIALLQGGAAAGSVENYAKDHLQVHAPGRIPNSPRLALAWAIESEKQAAVTRRAFGTRPSSEPDPRPTPDRIRAADVPLALYQALVSDPALGAEANVRLGHLLIQLHRHTDALPYLAAASRAQDRDIRYFAAFLTGQVHRRLGDMNLAENAYREALTAAPGGMSASLVLASVLADAGRWADADEVVARASNAGEPYDPWRLLVYGGYRQWPHWQGMLREQLRR